MSEARSYAVDSRSPALIRQEHLMPFLERLQLVDGDRVPRIPDAFTFSAELLALESWEIETLGAAFEAAGERPHFIETMAESIAFQAKVFTQLEDCERSGEAPPEVKRQLIEALIFDGAIGLALLEELQEDINLLITSSEMDAAKHLTTFRNRIGKQVIQIRDEVGDVAFEEAEARSADLVTPTENRLPDPNEREKPAGPDWANKEKAAAGPVQIKRRKSGKGKNKTLMLGGALVTLLAVWAVAVVLPRMSRPAPIEALTMGNFSSIPIVEAVVARPPSLFLDLDGAEWGRLSVEERMDVVNRVGQIVQPFEYQGAQLRDATGATVANWTVHGGTRLATTPTTTPTTTTTPATAAAAAAAAAAE